MSNDAQKLQDAAFAIHTLWGSPVLIVVIIGLMWSQVRYHAHQVLYSRLPRLADPQIVQGAIVCLGVVIVLFPNTHTCWQNRRRPGSSCPYNPLPFPPCPPSYPCPYPEPPS